MVFIMVDGIINVLLYARWYCVRARVKSVYWLFWVRGWGVRTRFKTSCGAWSLVDRRLTGRPLLLDVGSTGLGDWYGQEACSQIFNYFLKFLVYSY